MTPDTWSANTQIETSIDIIANKFELDLEKTPESRLRRCQLRGACLWDKPRTDERMITMEFGPCYLFGGSSPHLW